MKRPVEHIQIAGPVAQDKDYARGLRVTKILPSVAEGKYLVLDFSDVSTATQSFLHACISEAIRHYGEELLSSIEFRGCQADVRQLIATVITYSLRARTLTHGDPSTPLRKKDVPQADNLKVVRTVLDALASGGTSPEDIAHTTGFSVRHVHYRLHAARVLDLVWFSHNFATLTVRGRELLSYPIGSGSEREHLAAAVRQSKIIKKLCPTLLDAKAPSAADLSRRLEQSTGLSKATATRRAHALLSWRRSLLIDDQQQTFPGMFTE